MKRYLANMHERLTPPALYPYALKRWFSKCTGRQLDLKNPVTFCDKINWIKLYGTTPLMTRLSDKYQVRRWVKSRVGSKYLIPLIGKWRRACDIDFDRLPRSFVLKANHGCRMNLIVKDKRTLNLNKTRRLCREWLHTDFAFQFGFQLQYRDIPRLIIAEKYMENSGHGLLDYKFHCFGGRIECIEVIGGRGGDTRLAFFDTNWTLLEYRTNAYPLYDRADLPKKPESLNEMLYVAGKLCRGFAYVRVDLYMLDDGSVKFGEMTFTPSSGQCTWLPDGTDEMLGHLIELPRRT